MLLSTKLQWTMDIYRPMIRALDALRGSVGGRANDFGSILVASSKAKYNHVVVMIRLRVGFVEL